MLFSRVKINQITVLLTQHVLSASYFSEMFKSRYPQKFSQYKCNYYICKKSTTFKPIQGYSQKKKKAGVVVLRSKFSCGFNTL